MKELSRTSARVKRPQRPDSWRAALPCRCCTSPPVSLAILFRPAHISPAGFEECHKNLVEGKAVLFDRLYRAATFLHRSDDLRNEFARIFHCQAQLLLITHKAQ